MHQAMEDLTMSEYFLPYLKAACLLTALSLLLLVSGCPTTAAVPLYLGLASLLSAVYFWSQELGRSA